VHKGVHNFVVLFAFQFQNSRTGGDLLCYWHSVLRPMLNKQAWSRDEDKKLLRLAKQNNSRNWQQISLDLGVSVYHVEPILEKIALMGKIYLEV